MKVTADAKAKHKAWPHCYIYGVPTRNVIAVVFRRVLVDAD